jgi:hypothetical protein
MAGNFDELRKQIEADELGDQIEAAVAGEVEGCQVNMTVIDYGRAKGIQPQLIYYYIRSGKLKQKKCICGRWVLGIAEAETLFNAIHKKRTEKRSGVKQ